MSRNAEEGFADYQELFHSEVCLVFLKEPHINTEVYRQSVNKVMDIEVRTGNEAVDEYFSGNMELVNKLLMKLAKQQIKLAFEQAEKEVHDLHQRIAEGMRESKAKGNQIGIAKGTKLTTKKSRTCKTIIKTHCKAFGVSSLLQNRQLIFSKHILYFKIHFRLTFGFYNRAGLLMKLINGRVAPRNHHSSHYKLKHRVTDIRQNKR